MTRLDDLLQAHTMLCEAGKLPKSARPYGVQSNLDELQKLIMEEIKAEQKPRAKNDNDFPF